MRINEMEKLLRRLEPDFESDSINWDPQADQMRLIELALSTIKDLIAVVKAAKNVSPSATLGEWNTLHEAIEQLEGSEK